MKRFGNLYEQIVSIENLELADKKAQRGKNKQSGVIKHNRNRRQNILDLNESLVNQTYKTTKYSVFTIFEPKERVISVLEYFPNRIVHHALMNILEPILTKCFISQTYSCIKGRGIHRCLRGVRSALKDVDNTTYCLKLDIRKFYPSVNKELLKDLLRAKFKDEKLLRLLDDIIDSNEQGLPLGNLLSQWLANLYLNKFDHWLKEVVGVKYYFRYCDDLVILGADKQELHSLRKSIQEYLNDIHLELSNYQVFPVASRGVDFVGYVCYHTHTKVRKRIKINYKRVVALNKTKSIPSYEGWLLHGNCLNLKHTTNASKRIKTKLLCLW